ncbi:MAG: DMT family transporter [Pseudomonadota bacterium]|nr:DMT family transporter [Pseudomonadota bacterium]
MIGSFRQRLTKLSPNLRGFIWIALSTVAFMSMVMIVRHLADRYNTGELAFWRALIGLVLLVPVFGRTGSGLFRTRMFRWHLLRNLMHFIGVAGWFYAISQMNLSVGMSLQFTVPLFTILLAIVFLGERVDTVRWIATFIGFAGVLIILRPGLEPVTIAAISAIVSAVGYAGANIVTKVLMRDGTSDTIVFYMNVIHLPLALAAAWAMGGISMPQMTDAPWLIGLAATATLAHWMLARALALADASLIIIVDFTKLPWVTLGAFLFFGEAPVVWAWVGGAVIFVSTMYIVRKETRTVRSSSTTTD